MRAPLPLLLLAGAAAAVASALALRDRTTDSDETGEDVAAPSGLDALRSSPRLGERAVAALRRHLGEGGVGRKGTAGYHRGPFVDQVNGPALLGEPWCARAVRWAYEEAARELGLPAPFAGLGDLASVRKWKRSGARRLAAPRVGAALLLGDEHATLVAEVISPGEVVTVEGNHGDVVSCVRRAVRPQDTLLDVESLAQASRPAVVGGFNSYGRLRWT